MYSVSRNDVYVGYGLMLADVEQNRKIKVSWCEVAMEIVGVARLAIAECR